MASHKVVVKFRDKKTKKIYSKGDSYTHESDERIAFLIEKGYLKNEETTYPKHAGGGWYELSNGEKVQGKNEAAAAEKKLGE